jgi:hypothetical protein
MATSTSDTEPQSREAELSTIAEQVAAIDEIIGYARTQVQVFDIDLSTLGWNSVARIAALGRFLRATRTARLDVVVHDTRWVEAYGARFAQLLRQYPHAVTVYRSGSEARSAMDPLVIVDRSHCVHRFHADQARGALIVASPSAVKPLAARFDEIWGTGEPGMTSSVLGL